MKHKKHPSFFRKKTFIKEIWVLLFILLICGFCMLHSLGSFYLYPRLLPLIPATDMSTLYTSNVSGTSLDQHPCLSIIAH